MQFIRLTCSCYLQPNIFILSDNLDNWAFIYAQRLAIKFKVPLQVCFCLVPTYQADTLRQFAFMIGGLTEVEQVSSFVFI